MLIWYMVKDNKKEKFTLGPGYWFTFFSKSIVQPIPSYEDFISRIRDDVPTARATKENYDLIASWAKDDPVRIICPDSYGFENIKDYTDMGSLDYDESINYLKHFTPVIKQSDCISLEVNSSEFKEIVEAKVELTHILKLPLPVKPHKIKQVIEDEIELSIFD